MMIHCPECKKQLKTPKRLSNQNPSPHYYCSNCNLIINSKDLEEFKGRELKDFWRNWKDEYGSDVVSGLTAIYNSRLQRIFPGDINCPLCGRQVPWKMKNPTEFECNHCGTTKIQDLIRLYFFDISKSEQN